jgi:hypothetical protein
MILERLVIERKPDYVDPKRGLRGRLKFAGNGTEIEVPVSEAAAQRILELAADGVIEAAGEMAALTRAQVLTAVAALPAETAQEAALRG